MLELRNFNSISDVYGHGALGYFQNAFKVNVVCFGCTKFSKQRMRNLELSVKKVAFDLQERVT